MVDKQVQTKPGKDSSSVFSRKAFDFFDGCYSKIEPALELAAGPLNGGSLLINNRRVELCQSYWRLLSE